MRAGLHALFFALVIAQAVQLARRAADELPRQRAWSDVIAGRSDGEPPNSLESYQGRAYRDVRGVLPAIPRDARVLVLTRNLSPIRFEYLLLPRVVDLMVEFEPAFVDALAQRFPQNEVTLRERFDELEARGVRATRERLLEKLALADFVLVFDAPPELPASAPRLEPVAEAGLARVYRPVPSRGSSEDGE
jgi:hypothetical protein